MPTVRTSVTSSAKCSMNSHQPLQCAEYVRTGASVVGTRMAAAAMRLNGCSGSNGQNNGEGR